MFGFEEVTPEELKDKIDRGDHFKLIMVSSPWGFEALHIPGSVPLDRHGLLLRDLRKSDDIVVYDSNDGCTASIRLSLALQHSAYTNVKRLVGGILAWERAGYRLEGLLAGDGKEAPIPPREDRIVA